MSEDQDKAPKQRGLLSGCYCWAYEGSFALRLLLPSDTNVISAISQLQNMLGLLRARKPL